MCIYARSGIERSGVNGLAQLRLTRQWSNMKLSVISKPEYIPLIGRDVTCGLQHCYHREGNYRVLCSRLASRRRNEPREWQLTSAAAGQKSTANSPAPIEFLTNFD